MYEFCGIKLMGATNSERLITWATCETASIISINTRRA